MKVFKDLKQTYLCPLCKNVVYKAIDDNGNRIFVHVTANYYAEHKANCPSAHRFNNKKYGQAKKNARKKNEKQKK